MLKTILITGAVRGIGRDTALALAKRGHRVIATTRTAEQAAKLHQEAAEQGVTLETAQLDLTSAADIAQATAYDLDVLINNAATGESGPMAEIPLERVKNVFAVNVFGTLQLTQSVVKKMLQRPANKERGRIIILGSTAGRVTLPYLGPYHLSKYALESMADALRLELRSRRIPVSLIEPGLILTGFNEQVAATKYAWLKADSPFAADLQNMKRHDAALPRRSYPTDSVVAAIVEAVETRQPRARYMRPRFYRPMIFALKLLPQTVQDFILRRGVGSQ